MKRLLFHCLGATLLFLEVDVVGGESDGRGNTAVLKATVAAVERDSLASYKNIQSQMLQLELLEKQATKENNFVRAGLLRQMHVVSDRCSNRLLFQTMALRYLGGGKLTEAELAQISAAKKTGVDLTLGKMSSFVAVQQELKHIIEDFQKDLEPLLKANDTLH